MNKKAQARTIPIIRKNNAMKNKLRPQIKEHLQKLNTDQLKIFYAMIVHCRAHQKSFISTHNLFNLWCELNALCHDFDPSFPGPHDDHKLLKDFCQAHPYYFIDILPHVLITRLFSKYFDQRLEILSELIQIIHEQDIQAAYQYIITALDITDHTLEELVADLKEHLEYYS
jgi:hypothetical protein